MRILDLGAHDGYIASWVGRQLGDMQELRIDGVELNEDAVAIATQRAARYGIPGDFKVGLAEEAPGLFEPASYDAVIAFELVEHVADVDRFLRAAEAMLKPGGRVYLSTPDGTFGAGQNPHHLRVYRVIDLAEVCRRRGRLEDLRSGPDGIAFVVYTPWACLLEDLPHGSGEVAIWTGPAFKPWSPMDIERPGGLGGSETAATRLAQSLSGLGYAVTVYGEVSEQCTFRQVVFRHHSIFDPMLPRKALIASRNPHLLDRRGKAERCILWMHDTDCGDALTEQRAVNADAIVVLSRWHEAHVHHLYPFAARRTLLSANGIEPRYFADKHIDGEPITRLPHRAIYSSSPDRGLDFLLELWPEVRFHIPDAELVFCYADVYQAAATARKDLRSFFDRIEALSDQPGVINMGSQAQPALAKLMQSAGVWLHPSWNGNFGQRFYETFCIGAVEASAAGCHLVASRWGALPERMATADSFELIGTSDATSNVPPSRKVWVEAIVRGMLHANDPGVENSDSAMLQTWDSVALDFSAIIEGIMASLIA